MSVRAADNHNPTFEKIRNRGIFPQCETAGVSPPPEGEALARFKAAYLSDVYLHKGDPGVEDRLARCVELQFARWRWANENIETYVNMLRVAGHPDEKIDAMAAAGVPMSFKSVAQYGGFKFALLRLRHHLEEEESRLRNVEFLHTGSSVPGFSSNPLKGLAELPSKITKVGKSDVDLVFVADGVRESASAMIARGTTIRQYPTTMGDRSEDTRYGVRQDDIETMSPLMYKFIKRWEEELGAGIQVTFQETPTVPFNPWENLVQLIERP